MSLLMKALDKAAKDREEGGAEPAPAARAGDAFAPGAGAAKSGLALEPMAPQQATAPAAAPREASLSSGKPAGAESAAASRESEQAAAMIGASRRDTGGGAGAYLREHPLPVIGALAALFLISLGGYVLLQMANPSPLVKQPPPRSTPVAPIVPPSAPVASIGTPGATQPPIPLTSLLPPLREGAAREQPAMRQPATAASNAAASDAAAPAVAAAAPAPTAVRDTIKVTAEGATPTINPLLSAAYAALNAGNLDLSQQRYRQLLQSEPGNLDALLGLAAIATQQGDSTQASGHYLKVLELDPRNALAQAGLIGMLSQADPLAAETRLKQLIALDPSAYLYFVLGNVYADQNRWPDAQQTYFQAHHLQPDNPDYAYNLAVGLEHIGQPGPALNFYRRALKLAVAKGRANFSAATAQERISKLEKVVE
jgi:Tfp pilus assembly protein PilF